MSISESEQYNLLDRLAEEFAERFRRGERPALTEYTDRYPELADDIRELFPALVKVEQADEGQFNQESEANASGPSCPLKQVGDYRILREIGRGGMGVVYEAEQVSLGRRVALKVLPGHVASDRKALERFRREAKSAARLHHTNIVPVFEVGHDAEVAFYAMQFIQGEGLDQVIDELRRLHEPRRKSDRSAPGAAARPEVPATNARTPILTGAPERPEVPATAARTPTAAPAAARNRELGQMAQSLLTGRLLTEGRESPATGLAGTERFKLDATSGHESVATSGDLALAPPTADLSGSAVLRDSDAKPPGYHEPPPADPSSSAVLPGGTHVSDVDTSGRRLLFFRSVAQIGRQAAQGLAYAHARGVVHRDIKPSNLLLDTAGVVWITDFGLAKADDDGLTATGDILGTLRYMAPERFRGEGDARADIYALGLTLYELLTLRPAYESPDRLKLIERIKAEEPARPRSLDGRIPRDLETIVLKASEKDPGRRYPTTEAMAEDLRRFLADEPIHARQTTAVERYARWARRNPVIAGLGGVLTIVLVLATVASLLAMRRFAILAERQGHSATAERSARLEADHARNTAQNAGREMQRIAAQADADKETAQRENYRSTIKLAESMLQGDDDARFRVANVLWETQPELRGWEWGHLMAQAPLEEWGFQTDESGLHTIGATADGQFLVTAGSSGMVTLWDIDARRPVWQVKTGPVFKLAVDPLDRFVAVSTAESALPQFKILEITTGKVVHESKQTGKVDLAFSPTGKEIYVFDDRGTLQCIATSTWEPRAQTAVTGLLGPETSPGFRLIDRNTLFVDAAGEYVGIFCSFGTTVPTLKFRFFDAHTLGSADQLERFQEHALNVSSPSTPVFNSALGEMIFSFTSEVYRKTFEFNRSLLCTHSDYVTHLALDSVTGTVLAATAKGAVQIVDADGRKQSILHGARIAGLAPLSRGRFITAGADGLMKCWKLTPPGSLAFKAPTQPDGASAEVVAFAHDGKRLLYQTWDRSHHFLYEMDSLEDHLFQHPDNRRSSKRFPLIRPRTNEMVADSAQGLVFFTLGSKGIEGQSTRSIPIAKPGDAAFDASGRMLVVSSLEAPLAVFDLESGGQLPGPEVKGTGLVAINPSGTRAAILTSDGLQVWETATGRLLNRLDVAIGNKTVSPRERELALFKSAPIGLNAPVFHPDGELIAVVENGAGSNSQLILWDSKLGKTHSVIKSDSGINFGPCRFSTDGQRLFAQSSEEKVRVIDWRLGKELMTLSGGKNVWVLAVSPDGRTVAYAGYEPNLLIAKSLPWQGKTPRDIAFYRAVDDLRLFTARTDRRVLANAEIEEILGDVAHRQGRHDDAKAHYTKTIPIRQQLVLDNLSKAEPQGSLATVILKRLAVLEPSEPDQGTEVLNQAAKFWEKLLENPAANRTGWQHLLGFQLRLVDHQVASESDAAARQLKSLLPFWGKQSVQKPADRLFAYALSELCRRVPVVYPDGFDQEMLDTLVAAPGGLIRAVGDAYADKQGWASAIAIYSRGISKDSPDPSLLAKRAKAHEQLRDWKAAAADWSRLAAQDFPGFRLFSEFARRLEQNAPAPSAPEVEKKKWQELWGEVEATFARAESRAGQADEYLALALAYQRHGAKDKATLAYSKAVGLMRPFGENAFVRQVVGEALRAFGADGPEAPVLLAAAAGEPPVAFTQAIQNQPGQADGYLARGEWYGRRGLWQKAADDLAVAYRLRPEVYTGSQRQNLLARFRQLSELHERRAYTGMQLGIVLAWVGEVDLYRDHCRELVDHVAMTNDESDAERTLKACGLLGPGLVGDPTRIARLFEVAMSGDQSQPVFVWYALARALYEYRVGRFDAAVKTSRANRTRIKAVGGPDPAVAMVFAVEALALYRSGDADGARRSLAEAKKLIDEKFLVLLGGDLGQLWHDWLAAQLLCREALAEPRLEAVMRGEDKPADNAERSAFARIAYDHKKFAAATRLWAEAMASDPKLGDSRQAQHRYNAARAAVLTAAGQGQDEPPLDLAAKAKLRQQALLWLKAELTAGNKLKPRVAIVRTLSHWQRDSALASIRDAAALAQLPVEEQKAFSQFWADVAKAAEPADNPERLALAQIAYDGKQFAAATRLYVGAFANDPKLADGVHPGNRYDAARVAALAGSGRGKDAPPEEAERALPRPGAGLASRSPGIQDQAPGGRHAHGGGERPRMAAVLASRPRPRLNPRRPCSGQAPRDRAEAVEGALGGCRFAPETRCRVQCVADGASQRPQEGTRRGSLEPQRSRAPLPSGARGLPQDAGTGQSYDRRFDA